MPAADCSPVRRLMPLCLLPTPAHALSPAHRPHGFPKYPGAPPLLRASSTRAEARAATLQAAGVTSLTGMAKALNTRGVPPPRGRGPWYPIHVLGPGCAG
jgi:hypothetical protein